MLLEEGGMPHSGKNGLVPTFLEFVDAMKFGMNIFFPGLFLADLLKNKMQSIFSVVDLLWVCEPNLKALRV